MNKIYYTIGVIQNGKYYDQDYDLAFDILSTHGESSPGSYSPKFYGYDLSRSRIVIFKIILVNYDPVTENHSSMGFAPLVEFGGDKVNPNMVLETFLKAKKGEFDNFGNQKKTRKIFIDQAGNISQEESSSVDESGTGGEGILPFGLPGFAFPFIGVPPIIFLILTGVSAIKLADTGNPVWAATGAYTYIHYRKNLNK